MTKTIWPKIIPPLTPEQRKISDDFMAYWHQVLPQRYSAIDRFNHHYPRKRSGNFLTTLEIGAGNGEHLTYENLTPQQQQNYFALELRENMVAQLRRRFPAIQVITGDCQKTLPFADGYFDRILAIHVLEHLPNLPSAIQEMHRLCHKERGQFLVVIPCEGGMAYSLARRISAQRIFEKRYGQPYHWFISREHLNRPTEILAELRPFFRVVHRRFFPLWVPWVFCNLVIGLTLKPR